MMGALHLFLRKMPRVNDVKVCLPNMTSPNIGFSGSCLKASGQKLANVKVEPMP